MTQPQIVCFSHGLDRSCNHAHPSSEIIYDFSSIGTNFANSYNQARQAAAANKAAEAQAELVRIENKRLEQEYAEKLRLQELEKKRIEEERRIQEEKNPNSILNKFKNANVNRENEELKNKLKQME